MKNPILIIGSNSNIGSYIALKLLSKGEKVILHYNKNSERINSLIKKFPDNSEKISFDITEFEEVKIKFELKSLILCSSLRSSDFKSLKDSNPEQWKDIIDTNLIGTYNVLKVAIPKIERKGSIILFGSNVSRIGLPFGSAYSASKAAISNICRSLAVELEDRVFVNTISPGPVKIDDSGFSKEYKKFRKEYYDKMKKGIPMKRLAEIEDIYNLCEFLVFKNTYITGEEFFVTGGKL